MKNDHRSEFSNLSNWKEELYLLGRSVVGLLLGWHFNVIPLKLSYYQPFFET